MIRPVTLSDIWTLRRKPRSQVTLYNEAMLASPHRPFWFALRCWLEGSAQDCATYVYREGALSAVVQSIGRRGRPEHDVALMAAYGGGNGHPTDPDVWFRLLESLCAEVGAARIQRIYAALPQRHNELREIFRQAGFTGYTQQSVLRLDGPDWDQGTTLAPMRPQSNHDVWAIHKLYGAVTPRQVQLFEARDARSWMLPLDRVWRRPYRNAWVLGAGDRMVAYLHRTTGPVGHVFSLLIRPDAREQMTDVLRFGLAQIHDALPVYLILRDYQQELFLPAGDLGFHPVADHTLLCKQTTVAARRSLLTPVLESPETHPPIPTISSQCEDRRFYGSATGYYQQYRTTSGNASGACSSGD